jgi:chromosome segregation ATPase
MDRLTLQYQAICEERNKQRKLFEEQERKKRALADRRQEYELSKASVEADGERERALIEKYDHVLAEREALAQNCQKCVSGFAENFVRLIKTNGCRYLKLSSERKRVEGEMKELVQEQGTFGAEREATTGKIGQLHKDCLVMAERLKEMQISATDTALLDRLKSVPDTVKELTVAIARSLARIDTLEQSCSGVDFARLRREHQSRQTEMDQLLARSKERRERAEELAGRIAAEREPWLNRLQSIVSAISTKFGDLFAELPAVGQVDLLPSIDSLAHAELAIMVKFRATDPSLQRLCASRQSGGEKSVSTIVYLLAVSRAVDYPCPFRVVDEINQGMDAGNERRVHQLMCSLASTASGASGGQYFVITPKLLAGLDYNERVHIHCVFNHH